MVIYKNWTENEYKAGSAPPIHQQQKRALEILESYCSGPL